MNDFVFWLVVFFVIVIFLVLASIATSKPKREYGVRSVTAKGEEVRSIAEKSIADYFEKTNINYFYEQKPVFSFDFKKFRISFPDFYLPDYDVYIEYWGLVNADDGWTKARARDPHMESCLENGFMTSGRWYILPMV
jgi:hypothetical protein